MPGPRIWTADNRSSGRRIVPPETDATMPTPNPESGTGSTRRHGADGRRRRRTASTIPGAERARRAGLGASDESWEGTIRTPGRGCTPRRRRGRTASIESRTGMRIWSRARTRGGSSSSLVLPPSSSSSCLSSFLLRLRPRCRWCRRRRRNLRSKTTTTTTMPPPPPRGSTARTTPPWPPGIRTINIVRRIPHPPRTMPPRPPPTSTAGPTSRNDPASAIRPCTRRRSTIPTYGDFGV